MFFSVVKKKTTANTQITILLTNWRYTQTRYACNFTDKCIYALGIYTFIYFYDRIVKIYIYFKIWYKKNIIKAKLNNDDGTYQQFSCMPQLFIYLYFEATVYLFFAKCQYLFHYIEFESLLLDTLWQSIIWIYSLPNPVL